MELRSQATHETYRAGTGDDQAEKSRAEQQEQPRDRLEGTDGRGQAEQQEKTQLTTQSPTKTGAVARLVTIPVKIINVQSLRLICTQGDETGDQTEQLPERAEPLMQQQHTLQMPRGGSQSEQHPPNEEEPQDRSEQQEQPSNIIERNQECARAELQEKTQNTTQYPTKTGSVARLVPSPITNSYCPPLIVKILKGTGKDQAEQSHRAEQRPPPSPPIPAPGTPQESITAALEAPDRAEQKPGNQELDQAEQMQDVQPDMQQETGTIPKNTRQSPTKKGAVLRYNQVPLKPPKKQLLTPTFEKGNWKKGIRAEHQQNLAEPNMDQAEHSTHTHSSECTARWGDSMARWERSDKVLRRIINHANKNNLPYQLAGKEMEWLEKKEKKIGIEQEPPDCNLEECKKDIRRLEGITTKNWKNITMATSLQEEPQEQEREDPGYKGWKEWKTREDSRIEEREGRLERQRLKNEYWALHRECTKIMEENKSRWLERKENERKRVLEEEKADRLMKVRKKQDAIKAKSLKKPKSEGEEMEKAARHTRRQENKERERLKGKQAMMESMWKQRREKDQRLVTAWSQKKLDKLDGNPKENKSSLEEDGIWMEEAARSLNVEERSSLEELSRKEEKLKEHENNPPNLSPKKPPLHPSGRNDETELEMTRGLKNSKSYGEEIILRQWPPQETDNVHPVRLETCVNTPTTPPPPRKKE